MMFIAHRGNVDGPNPSKENTPDYIDSAIADKFYVEVDVWGKEGELWLGHDSPLYNVPVSFFQEREGSLFCHCKNIEAYNLLQDVDWPNTFFHDADHYTITSSGFIWGYPGQELPGRGGILVLPERHMRLYDIPAYCTGKNVAGICSDWIRIVRDQVKS